MSRLLAALLLISPLAAVARPGGGPVVETEARATAQIWAQTDAAKALLARYLKALDAATDCEAGPCGIAAIKAQTDELRALDEEENALPRPPAASSAGRPLLALSALASGRLAHAAARTKDPEAAFYYALHDEISVAREAEGACLADKTACPTVRRLLEQAPPIRDSVNACVKPGCSFEEADAALLRASDAMIDFFALPDHPEAPTTSIFVLISRIRDMAVIVFSQKADAAADDLQTASDAFEKDLQKPDAPGATTRLQGGGKTLLEQNRRATVGADRLAYFLGYGDRKDPKSRAVREKVNLLEERLAGQRARAHAILLARGLTPEPTDDGVAVGGGAAAGTKTVPTVAPVKTFLDRRLVPKAAGNGEPAPVILSGSPSTGVLIRRLVSSDPLERADAMRRLGLSETVGSPGAYAGQAFTQKADNSCAVAIQVQVLRAQGLLPPGDPTQQEDALMSEARSKGYRAGGTNGEGGTAPEFAGSLLADRGMIVVKHQNASWPDMESLLRRGGIAQAGVDATVLWDLGDAKRRPHSILITGAEIQKRGGRILGVYINDSGDEPPGAGRFIPIDKFKLAWLKYYTEIR